MQEGADKKVGGGDGIEGGEERRTRSGPKRPATVIGGVIFWDLWLNEVHFGLLTEDNPDFFKQIFRGCFGLHLASEAESDLAIGFCMARNSSMPTFSCQYWCIGLLFQLCEKIKKEENLRLLDLRLASRR